VSVQTTRVHGCLVHTTRVHDRVGLDPYRPIRAYRYPACRPVSGLHGATELILVNEKHHIHTAVFSQDVSASKYRFIFRFFYHLLYLNTTHWSFKTSFASSIPYDVCSSDKRFELITLFLYIRLNYASVPSWNRKKILKCHYKTGHVLEIRDMLFSTRPVNYRKAILLPKMAEYYYYTTTLVKPFTNWQKVDLKRGPGRNPPPPPKSGQVRFLSVSERFH